jgi:hypothetical protein
MAKTLYLERANKDLICHCRCRSSVVAAAIQETTPWDGSGWLFNCMNCRKPYTFARGVEVEETLTELGREDLRSRTGEEPEAEDVERWVKWMSVLLKGIEAGREYVYFDGFYIDAETGPVEFDGWYAKHDLPWLPQVRAREDETVINDVLASEDYWRERANEDSTPKAE